MQLHCCNAFSITENDAEITVDKKLGVKSGSKSGAVKAKGVAPARLDQNVPNPFREETAISFYVPDNAKNAGIYIYNLLGSQVDKINIAQTGEGIVVVSGNRLAAGMYLYTLIIDQEVIDTKKMILTE